MMRLQAGLLLALLLAQGRHMAEFEAARAQACTVWPPQALPAATVARQGLELGHSLSSLPRVVRLRPRC